MSALDRILICVHATGLGYYDRTREVDGDYKRLGFMPFDTLDLEVEPDCPSGCRQIIEQDAAKLQARDGEQYAVSACGQTVELGAKKRPATALIGATNAQIERLRDHDCYAHARRLSEFDDWECSICNRLLQGG